MSKKNLPDEFKDSIDWHIDLGHRLIRLRKHDGSKGDPKAPVDAGWRESEGLTRSQAYRAVRKGHNLGWAPTGEHIIIDVDMHGKDGLATFKKIKKHLPSEHLVPKVESSRGGFHLYLRKPADARISAQNLKKKYGEGVDLIVNQQVVIPASIHPITGEPYIFSNMPSEVPFWTDSLEELLTAPRASRASRNEYDSPSIELLGEVLEGIPNDIDIDYDKWLGVGCAIHESTGGDDEGRELFHRWSALNDLYDEDYTDAKWDSLGNYTGETLGFGSLLYELKDHDKKLYASVVRNLHAPLDPAEDFAGLSTSTTNKTKSKSKITSLDEFRKLLVTTEEDLKGIREAEFIYENLILRGKITAIFGKPGHGKTTVATHIARTLGRSGFEVYYVLADIAGGDMPEEYESFFDVDGKQLVYPVFPNARQGQSMETVIEALKSLVLAGDRFDECIFFFDTYKKMAAPNHKEPQKVVIDLLRELNGRGATIVILAHTNKYVDDDGFPIPEGTNDLIADTDCSVLLFKYGDEGDMTFVSTYSDANGWDRGKFRGLYKPITFKWHASDRIDVQVHDCWLHTLKRHAESKLLCEARGTVDLITAALCSLGGSGSTDHITEEIHRTSPDVSKRGIRDTLNKWAWDEGTPQDELPTKLWEKEKVRGKNKYEYVLNDYDPDDQF